ncbi:MAG: PorV/PorQ family protein [Ignavibacteria bacterium]|nr:PorV/PorQ family protein [Ignavibacteria bacterium]
MRTKFLTFLFLITCNLFAQNAANTGYSFLKIGVGAGEVAQAEAVTAKFSSPFSVYYNPALIAQSNFSSIGLMHNEWIQDLRSEFLFANSSLYGVPIFLTVNSTSIANIEIRTRPGDAQGSFNAHYFFAGIGTGYQLFENLSFGFQVKYLYENIYVDESNGYAFDFGLFKKDLITDLNAGLSFRNFGKVNQLSSSSAELPSEVRFGLNYAGNLSVYKFNFSPSFDIQKFTKSGNLNFLVGLETNYDNLLNFRLGYNSMRELNHFSFGLGLNYKSIYFDYAFLPFTNNFGSANLISLYIKL